MSQTGLVWRLATLPQNHKMKTQYTCINIFSCTNKKFISVWND